VKEAAFNAAPIPVTEVTEMTVMHRSTRRHDPICFELSNIQYWLKR
jgi:hypothetical protein